MQRLSYEVRFTTPAFLGNAEQSGQWRTPPFKALLRQWWRAVYFARNRNNHFTIAAMREEEGKLFGHAWLESDTYVDERGQSKHTSARQSRVRVRLTRWDEGQLAKAQWPSHGAVSHPEVRVPVASDLYLGYGPVTLPRGASRPTLKAKAAIQAGESAELSLAVPDDHWPHLKQALWLMDRYGTVGGRSRNGWGSYQLTPIHGGDALTGTPPLRDWRQCLNLDWPHAIGQDEKGALIWQTAPHDDWKALMKTLAIIKIGLRTQFVFPKASPPHANPLPRHWLSYPTTTHTTHAFDRSARLPNQLRFKVRATGDGKLVGVIFHMPHLPPPAFKPDRKTIECVWQCVHRLLDALAASPNNPVWPRCECLGQETEANRQARLRDWWSKMNANDKQKLQLKRIAE